MYAYIFTFLLTIAYLVFGIILIIKKPIELSFIKRLIISILLFCFYFFPTIETLTNSSATNHTFLKYLPLYNYTPLMYIVSILALLINGRVGDVFKTLVAIMIIPMLYGIGDQSYLYITTAKGFLERNACYIFGQATIILYGIYLIRSKTIELSYKNITFAVLLLLLIYIFSTVYNYLYGTTFFGLTFNDSYYIYDRIKLNNYSISLAVNYLSIFITIIATGIVEKKIQKKWII